MTERKFEERWENFRDLVEHLFLEPGRGGHEADMIWYPATDVYETENAFVIRMDVSGVSREDLKIMMHGRALEVAGVRRDRTESEGRKTFHKMEIAMGPFARCIQLPERFAGGVTSAVYEDGVLQIQVAAASDPGPRDIQIEVE